MSITSAKLRLETPYFTECKDFYAALGFKIIEQWCEENDQGAVLSLPHQHSFQIEIAYKPESLLNPACSLQFEVEDIVQLTGALPSAMARSKPVRRCWGYIYVYLTDPAGNRVVLYQK